MHSVVHDSNSLFIRWIFRFVGFQWPHQKNPRLIHCIIYILSRAQQWAHKCIALRHKNEPHFQRSHSGKMATAMQPNDPAQRIVIFIFSKQYFMAYLAKCMLRLFCILLLMNCNFMMSSSTFAEPKLKRKLAAIKAKMKITNSRLEKKEGAYFF